MKNTSVSNDSLKRSKPSSEKTKKNHNHTTILGYITQSPQRRFLQVTPFHEDFLGTILLKKEELKRSGARLHTIVRVALRRTKGSFFEGDILETYDSLDDPELELAIVQEVHGFPIDFSPASLTQAQNARKLLENPGKRTDLRNTLHVTIDGETARDFDDAISVERTENGGYRLFVSIADVSFFITENSPLDLESRQRGTSIYFTDRAIPMLPEIISNDLCSLRPDEDKFTLTCEMEISSAGHCTASKVYASTIKSAGRLTYTNVAKLIENNKRGIFSKSIEEMLLIAHELSLKVRKLRTERGGLDLDLPETNFEVDDKGDVTRIVKAERNEAHRLIEDFMILANEVVASSIEKHDYDSIYRIHEDPDPAKIDRLQSVLKHWGFKISDKRDLAEALQDFLNQVKEHANQKTLVTSLLRSLKQARYSPVNHGHFGLGSESYTHFTSPIRRYPDLMVHRILRNSNFLKAKDGPFPKDLLEQISTSSSEMERRAFLAERTMEDIKGARYFEKHLNEEREGIVTSVKSFGLFVEIQPEGIDALIPMRTLPADFWSVDESESVLRGRRTGREFWLGDKLNVKIAQVDRMKRRVALYLVGSDDDEGGDRYGGRGRHGRGGSSGGGRRGRGHRRGGNRDRNERGGSGGGGGGGHRHGQKDRGGKRSKRGVRYL